MTEAYALEGPKLFRRGEWFYLVSAVGGTAGPPTSHMVTVARSRSVHGPWENDPARFETSGYHANTVSDLLSLRPALFAAGRVTATFRDFRYRVVG